MVTSLGLVAEWLGRRISSEYEVKAWRQRAAGFYWLQLNGLNVYVTVFIIFQ